MKPAAESAKKKILVADIQIGQRAVEKALHESFDLRKTNSLLEAKQMLESSIIHTRNNFSLIICGVHFDECKMFELLDFVSRNQKFDHLPFLVIQAQRGMLNIDKTANTARLLGAAQVLDLQNLSTLDAVESLTQSVVQILDGQRGKNDQI